MTRRSLLKAGACALASQSCPLQMSGVPAAAAAAAEPAVTSFRYHAPQSALDDLRLRLRRTRLPDRQTCSDWSQGIPLAQLQALLDYWQNVYDWRRCEARPALDYCAQLPDRAYRWLSWPPAGFSRAAARDQVRPHSRAELREQTRA